MAHHTNIAERVRALRDADISEAWETYIRLLVKNAKGTTLTDSELQEAKIVVALLGRFEAVQVDWMQARRYRDNWVKAQELDPADRARIPFTDAMCRIRDSHKELFTHMDYEALLED